MQQILNELGPAARHQDRGDAQRRARRRVATSRRSPASAIPVTIFTENDDLDLSRFAPKSGLETPRVPPETVRKVSEEGGFPSRTPKPRAPAKPVKRLSMVKTGRTELLNARI